MCLGLTRLGWVRNNENNEVSPQMLLNQINHIYIYKNIVASEMTANYQISNSIFFETV